MALGIPILDQGDPGLYRTQRGRRGAEDLMVPDAGAGGRYVITTGEGQAPMVDKGLRNLLDTTSPAFALLVLGTLLIVINGAGFSLKASAHL